MKKLLLLMALALTSAGAYAQKIVSQEFTQARLLDVTSNAYVRPLTVELKVKKTTRERVPVHLTPEQVSNMKGELDNIRSYAVYEVSRKLDCDVIVAATFNIKSTPNGCDVEVVGYPADFVNWKTATSQDYEWIRMEKTQTTSDRDKIAAAIKN